MTENNSVRIDKFLWAVRIYKTRNIAAEECKKGRIVINNVQVKPSRVVSRDEIIIVRKLPVVYTYKIIEPIENRVAAKMVPCFIEDLTPDEEKMKLEIRLSGLDGNRLKGTGRPTKKERRDLDRLRNGFDER